VANYGSLKCVQKMRLISMRLTIPFELCSLTWQAIFNSVPSKLTSSLPVYWSFNSCAKNVAKMHYVQMMWLIVHWMPSESINGVFHVAKHEFLLQIWEIGDLSTDNAGYRSNIHFCAFFAANSLKLIMWVEWLLFIWAPWC
jgi:hypothetical protein